MTEAQRARRGAGSRLRILGFLTRMSLSVEASFTLRVKLPLPSPYGRPTGVCQILRKLGNDMGLLQEKRGTVRLAELNRIGGQRVNRRGQEKTGEVLALVGSRNR